METLDKNLLLYLAYDLDMPTVYRLCKTSKRFNRLICQNDIFWRNKLLQYGVKNISDYENPKKAYEQITRKESLLSASEKGNIYKVKYLIEKGDINMHEINTSFMFASEQNRLDVVKYLLEKGADIHFGNDVAIWRASARGSLDVVKYLVKNGADITSRPYYGKTSIQVADQFDQKEVVKYLLAPF